MQEDRRQWLKQAGSVATALLAPSMLSRCAPFSLATDVEQSESIGALRHRSPTAASVLVKGLRTPCKSSESFREYFWDPNARQPPDGLNVIESSIPNANGRWVARLGNVLDVRWCGAEGNGISDDVSAFNLAISTGVPLILVPSSSKFYLLRSALQLSKGQSIVGWPRSARLTFRFDGQTCIRLGESAALVRLDISVAYEARQRKGVVLKLDRKSASLIDVNVSGGGTYNVEISSSECRMIRGHQSNSLGTAVAIIGNRAESNLVSDVKFSNNKGFGVWITGGASGNMVARCSTHSNGLELVGITYDSSGNVLVGNYAARSGDNGISVTGRDNVIVRNHCEYNNYHGIGIFGDNNLVLENSCINNGQANLSGRELAFAGISVTPNFGGTGRRNQILRNQCLDTQDIKTQMFGIKLERGQYKAWASGRGLAVNKRYVTHGGKIYRAMGNLSKGLVTGDASPSSGEVQKSAGSVVWKPIGDALELGPTELNSELQREHARNIGFDAFDNLVAFNKCSGNPKGSVGRLSRMRNLIVDAW